MRRDPGPDDAETIARLVFGRAPDRLARFETGLRHFVYDLSFSDGTGAVVRIGGADSSATIAGGLHWSKLLRPRGVPLPEVLHDDLSCRHVPFPFMVLERLPGEDLGAVYPEMRPAERRALAFVLASIQSEVTSLSGAGGFGFAFSLDGPFPQSSWAEVVAGQLARSRRRIEAAGHLDAAPVAEVSAAAQAFAGYFHDVKPTPFLHDITTKNVIVRDGTLSGIVDVDDLCFGDPLFLLGLINMALLASGFALDYVDHWKEALSVTPHQEAVLAFYTALFSVDFLAEIGQRFNRASPMPHDPAYEARLRDVLAAALRDCRRP